MHCFRVLRFLYSVEKNRKAFKLIFPPEIFGSFIDIGNYNKEFSSYIPLLKKFNKKLTFKALENIAENFSQLETYMKVNQSSQKLIGSFQVIDIIGKGAFGSVYEVVKGESRYAMKELPISHFDVTPEQYAAFAKPDESTDDLVVEEICKEVSILKELDHPNITKYYTSFAE